MATHIFDDIWIMKIAYQEDIVDFYESQGYIVRVYYYAHKLHVKLFQR